MMNTLKSTKAKSLFFSLLLFSTCLFTFTGCSKADDENPDLPASKDNTYIIISDLHLSDKRSIDNGYAWTISNKDTLKRFLEWIDTRNDWNELVILGDMLEEWICLPEMPTLADSDGNILTEEEFFGQLISFHKDVFDILYKLKNKGRTLVYVPGNHDMQATHEDFEKYLPGLFEFRQSSAGLGEYTPDEHIYMEHGHRYDILNAPYRYKAGIDDIPDGSILPPAFFSSKIIAGAGYKGADSHKHLSSPLCTDSGSTSDSYDAVWYGIGIGFGTDSVMTATDGMTRKYGFNDFAFSTAKLFFDINVTGNPDIGWERVCRDNNALLVPDVLTSISTSVFGQACDTIALRLLNGPLSARILIWGHAHEPQFLESQNSEKGKGIYLNTGCWCDLKDNGKNTRTFGEIKCNDGHYSVKLCRYDVGADGSDTVTIIKEAGL